MNIKCLLGASGCNFSTLCVAFKSFQLSLGSNIRIFLDALDKFGVGFVVDGKMWSGKVVKDSVYIEKPWQIVKITVPCEMNDIGDISRTHNLENLQFATNLMSFVEKFHAYNFTPNFCGYVHVLDCKMIEFYFCDELHAKMIKITFIHGYYDYDMNVEPLTEDQLDRLLRNT